MDVRLHLVSPPWSNPDLTSIQTGSLHAHVKATFGERVPVASYAPHVTVIRRIWGVDLVQTFADVHELGEYLSLLAYRRTFEGAREDRKVIDAVNDYLAKRNARTRLPRDFGAELASELDAYIERKLVPSLSRDSLNVVGLTTNFNQVYAALYIVRYLRERHAGHRFLFVLGGASLTLPNVVPILHRCPLPLLLLVGEGEARLSALLQLCLAAPAEATPETLRRAAGETIAGVVRSEDPAALALAEDNPLRGTQVKLESLPIPNYDAHFAELRDLCSDESTFEFLKLACQVTVEGSRGCFAKCDFCALNSTWSGFRTNTADNIIRAVETLGERHGVRAIRFVDNVCDTWAEKLADHAIATGSQYTYFMELRASHPEAFWVKLALAGAVSVQVGVEALSPPLLDKIEKKTTVMQNLAAQKNLAELRIRAGSNLMLFHPKATLADVAETRRVVELTPHFPPYGLTTFLLAPGSPLHREWAERREGPYPRYQPLRGLPKPFERETFGLLRTRDYGASAEVHDAWRKFARWYRAFAARTRDARLDIFRLSPRSLMIHDHRTNKAKVHRLVDDEAVVYQACHRARDVRSIAELTRLPTARVQALVARFEAERLVVTVEGEHLALALRPRDELVASVRQAPPGRRARALPVLEGAVAAGE